MLRDLAREHSVDLFSRWGLWQEEVSLKLDAVKPVGWILKNCPELRVRALIGANIEGLLVEALLGEPHTVADLARITASSYASAHEAAMRLLARGILERSTGVGRRELVLAEPIKGWLQPYPNDLLHSSAATFSPGV